MSSMTRIHSVPLDPTSASLDTLEQTYQDHMREGAKLLKMAREMRLLAEQCIDDRGRLKDEYRATRVGADVESAEQITADHRLGGTKVMQDAKTDFMYFTRRAMVYSGEAAGQFSAAAAWMQYIERMRVRSGQ